MICIIGGGIAGLYAALLYADAYPGRRIEVHEASGRWGGHIQTYYGADYRYETGAGRFNSNHRLLNELIQRFHLTPQKIQSGKRYCDDEGKGKDEADAKGHDLPTLPRPTKAHEGMTFGEYLDRVYSPEKRRRFQEAFGYDAEFEFMNAADAMRLFKTDFRMTIQYYSLKEGLSELVKRIVKDLQGRAGVALFLRSPVKGWEWDAAKREVHVSFDGGTMKAYQEVYMAVPRKALIEMTWPKSPAVKEALGSVMDVPLHRLYGLFYKDSDYPSKRTTSALPIRQYIPVNPAKRISMVSYCDTGNATRWRRLYESDREKCKKVIEKTLVKMTRLCGEEKTIRLRWLRSYYWPDGVHVWRSGVSSKDVGRLLRTPLGSGVPCFIVGESYSPIQGWIEGALHTVQEVFAKK